MGKHCVHTYPPMCSGTHQVAPPPSPHWPYLGNVSVGPTPRLVLFLLQLQTQSFHRFLHPLDVQLAVVLILDSERSTSKTNIIDITKKRFFFKERKKVVTLSSVFTYITGCRNSPQRNRGTVVDIHVYANLLPLFCCFGKGGAFFF